jgi:hypothetical protein
MIGNSTSVSSFKKSDHTISKKVSFHESAQLKEFETSSDEVKQKADCVRDIRLKKSSSSYMNTAANDISKLKSAARSLLFKGEPVDAEPDHIRISDLLRIASRNSANNISTLGDTRGEILDEIASQALQIASQEVNPEPSAELSGRMAHLSFLQNYTLSPSTTVTDFDASLDFPFEVDDMPKMQANTATSSVPTTVDLPNIKDFSNNQKRKE